MLVDQAARLGEVDVGQAGVVVAAGSDQHVVYQARQFREEPLELFGIGGVKGGGTHSLDLGGGALEAVAIAADEDDVRALAASESRGFKADARAAADQDNSLAA